MKIGKAIFAGIVGGLAMTALAWLARSTGIELNGEMMLGTMLGSTAGPGTWTVGFMMHLALSALIALLYAAGFEFVAKRAGTVVGLEFSVLHILIAGVVMGMIQAVHPMIPEQMRSPGVFLVNMGPPVVFLFILEHLIYGSIVGALYGGVLHVTASAEPALRRR